MQSVGGAEARETGSVYMNWVSPGYFTTLRTPIYSGRDFSWGDTPASPKVAMINRTMARQYFGTDSPLGARIGSFDETFEVVGVVGDAKYLDVRETVQPTVYFHWSQQADEHLLEQNVRMGQFSIRSDLTPRSLADSARDTLHDVLPSMAITRVLTLQDQVNGSIARERLLSILSGCFAALGLLLAAIGLYGVMSYSVSRRTTEIGVRMALGAQTRQIAGMVLREASLLIVVGLTAGLICASLASRGLAALLFGLTPTDPMTGVIVSALMLVTGAAAAYLPSRRAAGIDPNLALRAE